MLLALGLFAFETGTAPFQQLARKSAWRHAETERVGTAPAGQYLGPANDTVTLSGVIAPGIAGRHSSLRTLREMAVEGEAHPLVDAQGFVYGDFVILSIDETRTHFIDTGEARKADFSIELRSVT